MKKLGNTNEIEISYFNNLQDPHLIRHNVFGFLLIFMDIICVIPIVGDPFSPQFFWASIIPIVLINLWGVLYIVAPYKFERSYYLFFGTLGIVNTYVYFIVIQKFLYIHIGVEGSIFFIMGLVLVILLLVFFQIFNMKMLHSGKYAKLQKNEWKLNVNPIIVASSCGYIIAQVIMSVFVTESVKWIVLIMAISGLSIVSAYFSTYIHKFFYIRKNYEIVKKVYPEFGLSKNNRKS
ncbi:hypothetical protein [Aquibacillus rhizosphaerae]|uniref:Uncharacterized protein n=1 Tax=Aquibacillus rhizosphaerae TaxID=3051431 RepID=A0ABT7LDM3_9BACI|nr:hypothetical protein [Aquibacillus sp. LR5S19]MDL4842646.1 hypothetical protein [Aquibacillus sp. LR5S19]